MKLREIGMSFSCMKIFTSLCYINYVHDAGHNNPPFYGMVALLMICYVDSTIRRNACSK